MLDSDVEFALNELIKDFARNHKQVKAIFKGTHPESCGNDNYHFLTGRNSGYDGKFEDALTNFNLELSESIIPRTENISMDSWPIDPEDAEEYFSGEFVYNR